MNIGIKPGDNDYAPKISTSGVISQSPGTVNALTRISNIFGRLASLFFITMWGSFILAGAYTVKSGFSIHKANTLRREEIMKELLSSSRNLDEDFEFASIGVLLNEFYY
jgi:hypothetical protein